VIAVDRDLNNEARILIDLAEDRAMTHTMARRQCIPARLDQYVNHNPRLIFKARLVFKAWPILAQLCQIPGLYSRPGLYLKPGFYSRKYGTSTTVLGRLFQILTIRAEKEYLRKP